jgi:hypothetical protein
LVEAAIVSAQPLRGRRTVADELVTGGIVQVRTVAAGDFRISRQQASTTTSGSGTLRAP